MTAPPEPSEPLTLFGGPLHEIGRQLGVIRGTHAVRLGLAIGVGVWLVVVGLMLIEGRGGGIFTLQVIGGHVRLLLVIPLFFVTESWVAPRMTAWVATISRACVARSPAALSAKVARANRLGCAWWPEALCLLAAIAVQIAGGRLQPYGTTGTYQLARFGLADLTYFHLGITVFRFLVFRWAWKLALWGWFLWRVSRLELRLLPGHPDRAAGLGTLELVQERFTPFVVALSSLQAASVAEALSTGALSTAGVYPWVAIVLLVECAIVLGPLLVFTDKLWACRTSGLDRYTELAERYTTEFEAKWIGRKVVDGEPLLGTPDIQSMADLASTFDGVRMMRWIGIGPRLLVMMAIAAVVPFAPLLLFEYPLAELTEKFFSRLVGI